MASYTEWSAASAHPFRSGFNPADGNVVGTCTQHTYLPHESHLSRMGRLGPAPCRARRFPSRRFLPFLSHHLQQQR